MPARSDRVVLRKHIPAGRDGAAALTMAILGRMPSPSTARHEPVLYELNVENLLLIERAQLRLAPGLNVLTGETGSGKTVLAHALDLLLGGRARPGIVRPGASEA
jgi:type II secretory pathway predicted ATPase ExeA